MIRRSFLLDASRDTAFQLFTEGFSRWWPAEYTWSGPVLEWIGLEPRAGGACFERGPHGFRCDFGRVLRWEAPHLLTLSWQIAPDRTPQPDPEKASEVEVRFVEEPGGTRVEFEHRDFERHGEGAAAYETAMDSEQGWDHILDRYRRAVGA